MDQNINPLPEVFEVKTTDGVIVLRTSQILYIKAERKFSLIFFDDNSSLIVFHMLSWFENFLCPPCFCRSHNSYLINCCHVYSVHHSNVILNDKIHIPMSRKKMNHFRENLRNFHIKFK